MYRIYIEVHEKKNVKSATVTQRLFGLNLNVPSNFIKGGARLLRLLLLLSPHKASAAAPVTHAHGNTQITVTCSGPLLFILAKRKMNESKLTSVLFNSKIRMGFVNTLLTEVLSPSCPFRLQIHRASLTDRHDISELSDFIAFSNFRKL